MIKKAEIDNGRGFDWGRASRDYARYRDIYPREFYQKILDMAWLPFEDPVAGQSEALVLKYNPEWTGCGEKRHPIAIPEIYSQYFTIESQEVFDLRVPFSRESWNGRMKACRGIEASLPEEDIAAFDAEHRHLLAAAAPEKVKVRHYAAISVLRKR